MLHPAGGGELLPQPDQLRPERLGVGAVAVVEPLRPLDEGLGVGGVAAHVAFFGARGEAALRGGCLAPVGALATSRGEWLEISAVVLSPDGRQRLAVSEQGLVAAASELGKAAADKLLAQGAAALIESVRPQETPSPP